MQKANYKWNLLSCSCICHFDETELIVQKHFFVKPGVNISLHETPTLMHMTCEVLFYSTLQSFHSTKYYITSQGLCNGVGLEVWVGGWKFHATKNPHNRGTLDGGAQKDNEEILVPNSVPNIFHVTIIIFSEIWGDEYFIMFH